MRTEEEETQEPPRPETRNGGGGGDPKTHARAQIAPVGRKIKSRHANRGAQLAKASQLTHKMHDKMRRSTRPAVLVISIDEPRGHWIIHVHAKSIELIVGAHLLLRIATTGIGAVIVPQNPKRAGLLPQEPSAMQLFRFFWSGIK